MQKEHKQKLKEEFESYWKEEVEEMYLALLHINPGACPTCNDNPNFISDLFEENGKLKQQVNKLKKQVEYVW